MIFIKIEKLPSGSYRIRKMYKGKVYAVTFDYKPTQKEAMQAMAVELDKIKSSAPHMTFEAVANKYIEIKINVLSPSTIVGYQSTMRNLSDEFSNENINDITPIIIQKEINDYSINRSPKTVRNAHVFISAVLGMFRPELNISTTLPQKRLLELERYTYQIIWPTLFGKMGKFMTTLQTRSMKIFANIKKNLIYLISDSMPCDTTTHP